MKALNIWVEGEKVVLYIGGNPSKGVKPVVTTELAHPQIIVDKEKNTIIIVETK